MFWRQQGLGKRFETRLRLNLNGLRQKWGRERESRAGWAHHRQKTISQLLVAGASQPVIWQKTNNKDMIWLQDGWYIDECGWGTGSNERNQRGDAIILSGPNETMETRTGTENLEFVWKLCEILRNLKENIDGKMIYINRGMKDGLEIINKEC